MRFLRKFQHRLKQLERHPRVNRLIGYTDILIKVVGNLEYQGDNPAVRAIYSPLRISLMMMVALFFVIFVLGSLVPFESAAVAKGTIVVLSNKKTVQHLEGGIIRAILVKEGDLVKKDQPLMELNDVAPKANKTILNGELYAARVTEARLHALKTPDATMVIASEIEKAAATNHDLAKAISTQQDLFLTQRDIQTGRLGTLKQRVEQFNEEIIGLEAQVKSAEAQLGLIEQEVGPMERLVKKGYAAKPQLLAIQRKKEELTGNRGQYLASIAKARQSITETQMQIVNTENEFATQNNDDLREVQTQITDLEEKLRAASDVMSRTIIAAPYEGIVTGLKYHTIGGVITAGTPIMDIVPQSDRLIVEAQVQPADIDVVAPGLDTKIVFAAYKSRNMPRLSGKVVHVSADTFSVQQGMQANPYYTARIEVNAKQLAKLDHKVKLYPGMPIEVFIRTGSRSFLGYLFAPITSSLQRAFTED